jgi:dTDP-4-amino-4,6-dideoxygalactose transaminase
MNTIPFYSLAHQHHQIRKEMDEAFARVVNENWFILGEEVVNFQKEFASYQNAKYCVGVGNGFDAIFLSLKAMGIGTGDEVLVPAHTYIATWLAVSRTGATPVPIDAESSTWMIDVDLVEKAITPRTKAILPVHLYGFGCDMERLMLLADKRHLKIIEDNAQATGASIDGKRLGSFGHCNAFSFYPTKNLGALGDGGAIVTNDEEVCQLILSYRNYGQRKKYDTELKGVNSRLDELQAAFLRLKLGRLDRWNNERVELAKIYREELQGIHDLRLPIPVEGLNPVYHIFPVLSSHRDRLHDFLLSLGIETMIHYPQLPYQQEAYKELKINSGSFPAAENIAARQLSLPIWPGMTRTEVLNVCRHIGAFYKLVK